MTRLTLQVPFLDLKWQYEQLAVELDTELRQVSASGVYVGGEKNAAFEEAFAHFCGVRYAAAVANGTDALRLALLAMELRPGDEVITSPLTFMATVEAISQAGGVPRLADVEEDTFLLDPERVRAGVGPRTRGILPVHLYGQMAPMDPLVSLARERGLFLIEDACQAHGAEDGGRKAGSLGTLGCFSFYPTKNLGAFGEAGLVTTQEQTLWRRVCILRDHGQERKDWHTCEGYNARMDILQAVILRVKLKHLDVWNERRRRIAAAYACGLADLPEVRLPVERPGAKHVYHLFAIRVPDREGLGRFLRERGILTACHYPVPVHLQPALRRLGYGPGDFPRAEACAAGVLSLPLFPGMEEAQVQRVIEEIRHYFGL
ncbi:MAG: DegT/DnrJ/EryC1/StrS family aminotransferase [Acidobacteria bacterium]|nr:DegT/DnrJ/EryC1/StrS family aminotransferase [Acidobacteriota bacterium]